MKQIILAYKEYPQDLLIVFSSVPMHREIMAVAFLFVLNAWCAKMVDDVGAHKCYTLLTVKGTEQAVTSSWSCP